MEQNDNYFNNKSEAEKLRNISNLVDFGAKQYVKEFGGDVKRDFPKDLRLSVANEFANEYKAEIDIQGGDML